MTATATRHLTITGHVQGVGYRWHLVQQARALGVDGWVRNRHDGSVEALAHGPAAAVQALLEWCRQGPAAARVEQVMVTLADVLPPQGFEQRETA